MFDRHLKAWHLIPDGPPAYTPSSGLLPVRRDDQRAMLKVAQHAEERSGAALMTWWDGDGAARVLAHDEEAILLERADEQASLAKLSAEGADDSAVRILCTTIARLHAPRSRPPPPLTPLTRWFRDLLAKPDCNCAAVQAATVTARELLDTSQDEVVLHGDIHHRNVLHFGARGWLAIDPKALIGERAFDYASIFCNPDYRTASDRVRFQHRLHLIAELAALDRIRLTKWVLSWAALSMLWKHSDGTSPDASREVARLAAAELEGR